MNTKKMIEFLKSIRGFVIYYNYDKKDWKIDEVIKRLQNVDMLISKQPYPEDIFTPIPKEDFAKINDLLKKEMGYPLDRLSGHIGREFYKSLIETLKEMLDESSKV